MTPLPERILRRASGWSWLAVAACAPLYAGTNGTTSPPASSDPSSLAARAAGCWELRWSTDAPVENGVAPDGVLEALPDSISLEDSGLFGSQGRLVSPATDPSGRGFGEPLAADGAPSTWEQRYRSNRWWVEDDRVFVSFSDRDSSSWSLSFEPVDAGMSGSASYRVRSGSDDGSVEATVEARRIGCPSR